MATEALLAALAVAAALAYAYLTWTFDYWRKRGVKYIKPVPLFGNTLDIALFRKSPAVQFQAFYHSRELRNEPFGGVFLGRRPCFVVRDPELIKRVMIKDFHHFSDRGIRFDEERNPLGTHLFNLNGWRWRALRVKLSPTFTSGKMKMMYGIMLECAEGLEKVLEEPARKCAVLEMKEPLAQFTTDVIGTCAFGLQFNSMINPDCKFREMGRRLFTASAWNGVKRTLLMVVPTIAAHLGISFVDKDLTRFFQEEVDNTVRTREENNIRRNDFMQLLIELKNKGVVRDDEVRDSATRDGQQVLEVTNNLIAAQAFIFFVAGFETSSTTMGFALYELALNPDMQDRLAEEIRSAIDDNDGRLTYDAVLGMKYLDMVVAETLRKYPPLGNLLRKVVKPYRIEGTDVVLEKDLRVFVPIYAIQMSEEYYPEPERFDPERFTPEERSKRHPMTYLPFGDGPRNCIGARFGLLQTKLGLCVLLRRFAFERCQETPYPPRLEPRGFVTVLKGGIVLRIRERAP